MRINRIFLFAGLILVAMLTRLIPHAPNFTAVTAVGLFAGFTFKKRILALLVPFMALWLSDLILNNFVYSGYYEGFTFLTEGFLWIYGGMAVAVIIGMFGLRGFKLTALLLGGLSAAVSFYLITNFGSWLGSSLYPPNFYGLIASYIAGLPFLLNQILGTLVYGSILFGSAYVLKIKPATSRADA